MTSPRPYHYVSVTRANGYAREYYYDCLRNDEYAGEADEGTSILAGAQAAQRRKLIDGYYWGKTIEEVRDSVIQLGPVVIGLPWLDGMYETSPSGLVNVEGNIVGGHAIVLDEYHPSKRLVGEDYSKRFNVFGWHNSWNEGYGVGGRGFIRFEDLRDLLRKWGEACIPTGRRIVRF